MQTGGKMQKSEKQKIAKSWLTYRLGSTAGLSHSTVYPKHWILPWSSKQELLLIQASLWWLCFHSHWNTVQVHSWLFDQRYLSLRRHSGKRMFRWEFPSRSSVGSTLWKKCKRTKDLLLYIKQHHITIILNLKKEVKTWNLFIVWNHKSSLFI